MSVRYDIDPARSVLSLAGALGTNTLFPQFPGADVTSYGGSLLVDIDDPLAPTSITFVAGQSAVAQINGAWLPNDVLGCDSGENCAGDAPNLILGDADPGDEAFGNYGLGVILTSEDLGFPPDEGEASFYVALRDLTLSLTSGPVPVTGGSFASTQSLTLDSGVFATNLSSTLNPVTGIVDSAGTSDLKGVNGPNTATAAGSYSVSGNVATLTIPMEFTFSGGEDVTLTMAGELVATRVVPPRVIPEPSSLLLLVAGCLVAGLGGRRRIRSAAVGVFQSRAADILPGK